MAQYSKTIKDGIPQKYRDAYSVQKTGARLRNIEWQFNLHSWIAWWGNDITHRGFGDEKLCMARLNDSGPYSPENCYKATNKQNRLDAIANGRMSVGSVKVFAEGVVYNSLTECAKHYGKTLGMVHHRCKSDAYTDWYKV